MSGYFIYSPCATHSRGIVLGDETTSDLVAGETTIDLVSLFLMGSDE